ncbi:hypothetical protein ACFSLT_19505 [Novosphingobium resinovorum]
MAEPMHGTLDIRQRPEDHFLDAIRDRFPVEAEIDRTLSRKMRLRASGDVYAAHSLDSLIEGTASLIRANVGDDFTISNARWLTGGASKIQVAFELEWQDGSARRQAPMVLRMEPNNPWSRPAASASSSCFRRSTGWCRCRPASGSIRMASTCRTPR